MLETGGPCSGSTPICLEVLIAHRGVVSFSHCVVGEAVMVASPAGLWISLTSHHSYTGKQRLLNAEDWDMRSQED